MLCSRSDICIADERPVIKTFLVTKEQLCKWSVLTETELGQVVDRYCVRYYHKTYTIANNVANSYD